MREVLSAIAVAAWFVGLISSIPKSLEMAGVTKVRNCYVSGGLSD
jgi:hypothetical protein